MPNLSHFKLNRLYRFLGSPTLKEAIEGIGVPHTEIDLINGSHMAIGLETPSPKHKLERLFLDLISKRK
ncbi:MAG: hypothetical protein WAM28_04200 [Chlamydiales bacterium]